MCTNVRLAKDAESNLTNASLLPSVHSGLAPQSHAGASVDVKTCHDCVGSKQATLNIASSG